MRKVKHRHWRSIWLGALALVTVIGSTATASAADLGGIDARRPGRPGGPIAQQRLILEMGDAHYRGQNTIFLKREIKARYPHLRLVNFDIKRVRVVAKSRHGRGQVSLMVGGVEADRATIYGTPQDFHVDRPYTFDRIVMQNFHRSQGAWQLALRGNIKVRRVVVVVNRSRGGGGVGPAPRPYSMDCSSWDHQFATCYARAGGIANARLQVRHSNAACVQGRTWGFTRDYLWVSNGCRATFIVTPTRRGGRF